jgi:hypothetical protein
MTRNLKTLGLALVAVFAMSAIAASTALAANDQFTTTKTTAWLTGTSHDNLYEITGAKQDFTCTTSQFTGTFKNKSTEVTVLATYTGLVNETPHNTEHKCSASIGTIKIDMNHCHYILTGFTDKEDPKASGKFDAKIWITCPEDPATKKEKEITITGAGTCTIQIPSQTPTEGGVVYENLPLHTGGAAVKVTATVTGITYTSTPACGLLGIKAEANDTDYKGTVIVTGYEDDPVKNPDTKELTKPIEGPQIPIEWSTEP